MLREAGLEVGPRRLADALAGLDRVDLTRRDDVYWTLRATLVSRGEHVGAFDRAFSAWFLRAPLGGRGGGPTPAELGIELPPRGGGPSRPTADAEPVEGEPSAGAWSADEILRRRDFAAMTPAELIRARALIAQLAVRRPRRRSRRLRPGPRGRQLDVRRLARASLATGGDPIERAMRGRVETPRKIVLLLDVSGSMEAYSRALLLFAHAVLRTGRRVEVFAFGTRLTRLTRDLAARDPDRALADAAARVVDWGGGTRIGSSVKAFNDGWGRGSAARGAVVVIASDGWERDDPDLVTREMGRLARAAYAIVWVNPLKGRPDYQPLAGGMRAALPYVDRFLPGHDLASLEALGETLAGIERRHAA